jgi:hypothetical protein
LPGRIGTVKRLGDMPQVFFVNARSLIANLQNQGVALMLQFYLDRCIFIS